MDAALAKSEQQWANKMEDLENRVDSILEALGWRMTQSLADNKANQSAMPSAGSARTEQLPRQGWEGGRREHRPRYIDMKGFCEDRDPFTKRMAGPEAVQHMEDLLAEIPEYVKNQVDHQRTIRLLSGRAMKYMLVVCLKDGAYLEARACRQRAWDLNNSLDSLFPKKQIAGRISRCSVQPEGWKVPLLQAAGKFTSA